MRNLIGLFSLTLEGGAGIVKGVSGNEDVAMAATVVEHGADMAKDQIKADPDASMTERLALGVSEFEDRGSRVR